MLAGTPLFAQVGFEENIVVGDSHATYWPQLVKAGDIDNDGDIDVVAFGRGLNWYENVDGQGNFGEKKVVQVAGNTAPGVSLHLVDLDNDGDLDILCSYTNKVTIYKNTDGLGNFVAQDTYTLGISYGSVPAYPSDIDGDGDIDMVCFYMINNGPFEGKIIALKNNGAGTFAPEQELATGNALIATSLIFTTDIDGDNDQDIVIGHNNYAKISWCKNLGNGNFGPVTEISDVAMQVTDIKAADMDMDGNLDLVAALKYSNEVVWYKNLNGLGTFSAVNVLTSAATATNAVFVADIHNNGTPDVIYTGTNEIAGLQTQQEHLATRK